MGRGTLGDISLGEGVDGKRCVGRYFVDGNDRFDIIFFFVLHFE